MRPMMSRLCPQPQPGRRASAYRDLLQGCAGRQAHLTKSPTSPVLARRRKEMRRS